VDDGATTTTGMRGGGYYDDHSEYQRRVAGTAAQLVARCVADTPQPAPRNTFVVADYGCSTGRNSIASVGAAVRAVRARWADQPLAAIHNDLPTNDWNALFANLRSAPDGYLRAAGPPVLALASAVSFFEPAAPAGSVSLGLSFSAAHWLRRQPEVAVPEGIYFPEATGRARDALTAQADADWTAFLAARAADLAPGARLLVQMVGTDPAPGPDAPRVTGRLLLRAMGEVAAQMAREGLLDPAALERYVLPVYARTPAEARRPVEGEGPPPAGAFEVEVCRVDEVPNPYLERWRSDGDADTYARSYAGFARAFTESSLREHLFAPAAPADVDRLVDDYYARLTERFAADPERDRFEDWTLTVVLARRDR
jgi:hypothetical protein